MKYNVFCSIYEIYERKDRSGTLLKVIKVNNLDSVWQKNKHPESCVPCKISRGQYRFALSPQLYMYSSVYYRLLTNVQCIMLLHDFNKYLKVEKFK